MDNPNRTIFDKSSSGKGGYCLPGASTDVSNHIPEKFLRRKKAFLPEITENEAVRHYNGLSVKNHHIDKGLYPLGSCTMKYNPKINDKTASYPGFAGLHPFQPESTAQGALELLFHLKELLAEISGMDDITLQPAAGAHGEFTALLMMRAYHIKNGNPRETVVFPDSAHGTNPASVALAGYKPVQIKSSEKGLVDVDALKEVMNENVAGFMLTNPNTLGLFEKDIIEIAEVCHSVDAQFYMDGANLNALLGRVKPGEMGFDIVHFNLHKTFSTPHGGGGPGAGALGFKKHLSPFAPVPAVAKAGDSFTLDYDKPDTIGRVHGFYGNFANLVRGYTYIRQLGLEGLRAVSKNAVINANYLREKLKEHYLLPHDRVCMHEFVISADRQKKKGIRTLDIAKRLMDFGFHPPTVYFPLIVSEAMMVEPTETESKAELDRFIEAMVQIDKEVDENPEMIKTAPHNTPVGRVDEGKAARELNVKWSPEE
ncbi:MAG: aminotransferase class V-fold PLP-dependent enzyme [candidate division Zixibacteria bacterium]|nr:aminotransferase class V-fold PLP-dependent enzyme [candidate division Zixibacteria bacterium]